MKMQRNRTRAGCDGFTLIEVLAALAIASVIIMASTALIHNVALFFDRGTRGVTEAERLMLAVERLAGDFSSARFVSRRTEEGAGCRCLRRRGRPASSLLVPVALHRGSLDDDLISLTVEQDGEVSRLVRRRATWPGPRARFEDVTPKDPVVLIEGKLDISFVFGRFTPDGALAWSASWAGERALPQYVRLNLRDRATGANLLGEADFVIRANAPAACGQADAAVACLICRDFDTGQRARSEKASAMKRSDPRSGVILVTVLWSIALLSALAMAAAVTFRGFAGVMAVERDRVQGAALLSAGLETAAGIIDALGDAPLLDNEAKVNLATGSVRSRLTDEGGRIDIGKAPAEVIAALLRSVGASQAAANDVAQRIVERRNPGNTPRPNVALGSTNSATGTLQQMGQPSTPEMGPPFSDLRQLQLVPGMRPEWVAGITPLATVFGSETINPLTAPPGVIAALPGVAKGQADAFVRARRSSSADVERLTRLIEPARRYLAVKPVRVASVELMAELANGYATGARSVIVVLPQDTLPYRVLVWTPVPSPRLL